MIVELVERASTTITYFIYSAELSFSVSSGRPAKTWRDVWSVSQIHNPIDPAIEQALFFCYNHKYEVKLTWVEQYHRGADQRAKIGAIV